MRDFKGIPYARIHNSEFDGQLLRGLFKEISDVLWDIGPSLRRLSDGSQADSSDTPIGGVIDHGQLLGLGDDDHSQYLLLAGRSGGQTLSQLTTETPLTVVGTTVGPDTLLHLENSGGSTYTLFAPDGFYTWVRSGSTPANPWHLYHDSASSTAVGLAIGRNGIDPAATISFDGKFVSKTGGSGISWFSDANYTYKFALGTKIAKHDINSLTALRTFTWPDSDGTIALTSDLFDTAADYTMTGHWLFAQTTDVNPTVIVRAGTHGASDWIFQVQNAGTSNILGVKPGTGGILHIRGGATVEIGEASAADSELWMYNSSSGAYQIYPASIGGGPYALRLPAASGTFQLMGAPTPGQQLDTGEMIYGAGTGSPAAILAAGSSGQFMKYGSVPLWTNIAETDIADGSLLARVASAETISGLWTFSHASGFQTNTITERTAGSGVTIDGVLLKDGKFSHALLDGSSHSDTVAALQSPGALIVADASSEWDDLPIGSIGHFLTVKDATTLEWRAIITSDLPTLPTHGASVHTDRTRSVWQDPTDDVWRTNSAGVGTKGSYPDRLRGCLLQNNVSADPYFDFVVHVPHDYSSGGNFVIHWWDWGGEAANDVIIEVSVYDLAAAGDVTTAASQQKTTLSSVGGTINKIYQSSLTAVGSFTAGDFVRVNIARCTFSDANDTWAGSMACFGIEFRYTADM